MPQAPDLSGAQPAAAAGPDTTEPEATRVALAMPIWRVARDGIIGCADPASLNVLRQSGADATPRLLAEARAAGGCRTTFRVNEWTLEARDGDLVRLRLANGPAMGLWFLRSDVTAP